MPTAKEVTLKMFERVRKGTKYILDAVPEDRLDYGVSDDSATIENLAFHISTMPLGTTLFAQGLFDKFPETEVLMSTFREHLGESMDNKNYGEMWEKSCDIMLDYFGSKSDEEWINDTYSHFLTRGPQTYLQGFLGMQNHMLQHRGSLTSTLRSAGIKVGLRQYWGMEPYDED